MSDDIRVALWADVESVLDRLCDQHRAEYAKLSDDMNVVKMKLLHFMMQGETNCLWFDGKPQAVLAIAPTPKGQPVTWLACSKEFFDRGLPAIRAARRYMTEAVQRHGVIASYVGSEHPQVVRWMQAIGFKLISDEPHLKKFLYGGTVATELA